MKSTHADKFIMHTLGPEIQIKGSSTRDFSICSPAARAKVIHHLLIAALGAGSCHLLKPGVCTHHTEAATASHPTFPLLPEEHPAAAEMSTPSSAQVQRRQSISACVKLHRLKSTHRFQS